MINSAYLKTFLNLCETLNFTRTAENLHMTQPGVSQHIKALEEELNVQVLSRQGRKIELTPQGEMLRQYALSQQSGEMELRDQLRNEEAIEGDLSIACSGTMATSLYPKLLELQTQYRDLRVSVEASPNNRTIELVANGDIAMGLISCDLDNPKLQVVPLGREKLSLVLPKSIEPTYDNLHGLGYINHPDGPYYASKVLGDNYPDYFKGFERLPISGYVNQLSQILLPVEIGLGFTVLPESSVDRYADLRRVYKVDLEVECLEKVNLIYKKYKPLPHRYKYVRELLDHIWKTK